MVPLFEAVPALRQKQTTVLVDLASRVNLGVNGEYPTQCWEMATSSCFLLGVRDHPLCFDSLIRTRFPVRQRDASVGGRNYRFT